MRIRGESVGSPSGPRIGRMTSSVAASSPATLPGSSLGDTLFPVEADMRAVDEVIRRRLDSDVALVRSIAEYIVASGGKRLRPALLLLACGAAGFRGKSRIALAAVVEFIHTATLLHDDVVDESRMRRGRDTANASFGNAAAVLVGDFLYSRAFQMMVELDDMRVMQVLAEATNTIAEGEVLQLMGSHDPDVNEARYLEVIRRKTAKLFEAAARLGAVLARSGGALEGALAGYGMHIGTAFQLVDDVLDYSGDAETIGKSLGDDLAEGKPTLPLIHAMRAGSAAHAAVVRHAIREGGGAEFPAVLQAIRASGSLDYALAAARREADAAVAALAPLPESEFKRSLIELASFSVTRKS
jgi:octaprenyl-diphosphate synthase